MNEVTLKSKTAIVIGATGGIGEAIARRLFDEGMNLALVARNETKLEKLQSQLGDKAEIFPADAGDMQQVVELFEKVKASFKSIDLVVIASGGWQASSLDDDADTASAALEQMIESNLLPAFNVGFVAAQFMLEQGYGRIFNISSHAAVRDLPGNLTYSPVKAAARKFFVSDLYSALENSKVKVTDIQPALVATPAMKEKIPQDKHDLVVAPEDIANMIVSIAKYPASRGVPEVLIDGYKF